MSDSVDALLADLVAFVACEERPYLEVMDAWRTSCPRLPIWEEANARGYVTRIRGAVRASDAGLRFLAERQT